jgi:hypothetical protein
VLPEPCRPPGNPEAPLRRPRMVRHEFLEPLLGVETDERRARILETVRRHPDMKSKDAVAMATTGNRGANLKTIAELLAGGIEIGKHGCRIVE